MVTWKKCRRTSSEHAPSGRRDALKKLVVKIVHPRSSSIVPESDSEYMQNPETKNYRGVRYRVELNKYVTEIRPSRSTKKIWLGTYDTAEEAARAFDIGNLCCKKNLPLNFPDSPRLLKKISPRLSPDETRNAIAKLAKEVARMVSLKASSSDCAAAKKAMELLQLETEVPEAAVLVKSELQTQHLETGSSSFGVTYTEVLEEQVATVMDYEESSEMATPMPLQAGGEGGSGSGSGSGSYSWNFNLSRMFIPDDNANVPLHKLINFGSETKYGDVLVHSYP